MKRAYLVCLFHLLATTLLLSQSDPIFVPAVSYSSGGYLAYSVQVADVNGDGKPDLVVANRCADINCANGSVDVLLGNGDGTFQTAVNHGSSGGQYAKSVAVADVNGDGKPDIVVTNECISSSNCTTGIVSVLLGNGDGTFQAVATYASGGPYAWSVAVGDVNGDGKPDLVVANQCCANGGGSVGVLLGNGDGTFQTAVTYGSGGQSTDSVAVGDVNGDGKPDVIVANECADSSCAKGSVGVLLGNGDGTFQVAVTYGADGAAVSIAIADVNGDNKPDLVVANCSTNSACKTPPPAGVVAVLLGNGDGTFQGAVSYGTGGQGASSVAVADVNGDGKPDLVVTNDCADSNCANGSVGMLLGNGDGTFQPVVTYGSGGVYAESVAVRDLNGDGTPDLMVANQCFSSGCTNGGVGVLLSISSTTTTIASSSNPASFGQSVTFTATVVPKGGSGTPTGTVTFSDGSTPLGTSPLNGGKATFSTAALTIGLHSITAVYSGASNFSSSSASLNQTVLATTTTTLASSANPSMSGSSVTFTATVTTNGSTAPTGTVKFMDGATALGTGALNGSGIGTYTTSSLAVGQHSMTAVYSGDTNHAGSTSSVLTQKVNAATTTTVLVSSANPSMSGSSVMFTATVTTSGSITPTGKVTFMDAATTLGTGTLNGGVAQYTTSSLAVGQHSVSAVYAGDANNVGSTSSVLTQTVNAADFTFISDPTSRTVTAGHSGTFTLTVTPQGSFTSPISFSCSGLPALAGCTFSPASVTPNTNTATTNLTISTASRTASLAPPEFGRRSRPLYAMWLVLPGMLLGTVGMAAPKGRKLLSYCLVFLLVGGCLLQVACGGASNGSGKGGGGTPTGTYTVTVTGAAGSTQHTTTVTLTVQ